MPDDYRPTWHGNPVMWLSHLHVREVVPAPFVRAVHPLFVLRSKLPLGVAVVEGIADVLLMEADLRQLVDQGSLTHRLIRGPRGVVTVGRGHSG